MADSSTLPKPEKRKPLTRPCAAAECGRQVVAKGYCGRHYMAWKRHGDPLRIGTPRGAASKFLHDALLWTSDDCLIFPYSTGSVGYAVGRADGRKINGHRWICEQVHGKPTGRMDAAHSCGNRSCVNPLHLRWATRSENLADRDAHGTHQKGENAPWAKLTADDVREIRRLRGVDTQEAIGRRFGIPQSYVSEIQLGKVWESVT